MELGAKTRKGGNALLGMRARQTFDRILLLALAAFAGICIYADFGSEGAYRRLVTLMFGQPLGLGILGLFIISLAGGAITDFIYALKPVPPSRDSVRAMDVFFSFPAAAPSFAVPGDAWTDAVTGWAAGKGFRDISSGDGAILALKGRWSFIPGATLKLGLILLLSATAASHGFREADTAMLAPGGSGSLFGVPVEMTGLESDIPNSYLQVGKEQGFRINTARATVRVSGNESAISAGWPEHAGGLWLKITGIGMAQEFLHEGGAAETGPLMLDIFPPGREDKIRIGLRSLKVALSPERTVKKGRLTGEMYNLEMPSYRITPPEGDFVLLGRDGTGKDAEAMPYSLGPMGYWVRIEGVRDPALGMVHFGIFVLGAGLLLVPMNLFWYRRELAFALDDDGIVLGYTEQILKKWGVYRFYDWKDEIADLPGAGTHGD